MDTNTTHAVLFFIAFALCGFGQFLDCRTTDVGLAHGFIEANSFAGKIYSKIGATGFFVLKCMVFPAIGAGIAAYAGFGPSLVWLSIFAAVGFAAGIHNYLLLKKNKIAVF